jgi:hypothetical protein
LPVNQFTAAATALNHCGRTGDWMSRAGLNGEDHDQVQH